MPDAPKTPDLAQEMGLMFESEPGAGVDEARTAAERLAAERG